MKIILRNSLMVITTILLTGSMAYAMQPPANTYVKAEAKTNLKAPEQKTSSESPKIASASPPVVKATIAPPVVVQAPVAPPVKPLDNEHITWNFFIADGYTKEQTAGIMGNLKQEHNFLTSNTLEGLGIAQWMGNRRINLESRTNYLDITVQLKFLLDELNTGYHVTNVLLKESTNVSDATMIFEHGYEGCGNCREMQRILYARSILDTY